MNREELSAYLKKEEAHWLSGDLSYIEHRFSSDGLPWDYCKKLEDFLKSRVRVLCMSDEDKEIVLRAGHPGELVSVFDDACIDNAKVMCLPFADNSFDLAVNRYKNYDLKELSRVISPSGFFITEQTGSESGCALSQLLGLKPPDMPSLFNLENESVKFAGSGFKVMYADQAYPENRFCDVGAFCFYAKNRPREFPGFSVERCEKELFSLYDEAERKGYISDEDHKFILIGKNIKAKPSV